MKNFIFQGSPDIFDIDGYLTEAAEKNIPIRWEVKRYANDMNIGDRAFLWRAAGKQKEVGGVVGVGTIISKPALTKDDELSKKYWREERPESEAMRVEIEVTGLNLGAREVVQRKWMLADPVLENLMILKMASGTNFPLTPAHAERLLQLTTNTGVSWTKEESMAAFLK